MCPQRGHTETPQNQTVTENDLVKYCSVSAVKSMRLELVASDERLKYRVYVKGSWTADGECLLITWRRTPREWVSVDRFLLHVRDTYRYKGRIMIDI